MVISLINGMLINFGLLIFYTRQCNAIFLKNFVLINTLISIILTIISFFEIGYCNEMVFLYLFN